MARLHPQADASALAECIIRGHGVPVGELAEFAAAVEQEALGEVALWLFRNASSALPDVTARFLRSAADMLHETSVGGPSWCEWLRELDLDEVAS